MTIIFIYIFLNRNYLIRNQPKVVGDGEPVDGGRQVPGGDFGEALPARLVLHQRGHHRLVAHAWARPLCKQIF